MSTAMDGSGSAATISARVAHKVWREVARPIRRLSRRIHAGAPTAAAPPVVDEAPRPYLTGTGASVSGFHPQQATVEPEGIPLIQKLVREAAAHSGPIIEVGTLLGVTTTTMALAKAPQQKIITVDVYCWNPWGLTPDAHEALTAQVLHYLVETEQVERVRMDKSEFFRTYRGPAPSLAFLDAMHDYEGTKEDIEWAQRVGTKIIAGHDYCDAFPGVKQIVDEMGGPRELAGSVWVL
jgi:hypothetical protein